MDNKTDHIPHWKGKRNAQSQPQDIKRKQKNDNGHYLIYFSSNIKDKVIKHALPKIAHD